MDKYILDFVGNNWLTMYLVITALKGIAIITPSVKDDKIVTLLAQVYSVLRGGIAPKQIECLENTDDHEK